MKFLTPDLIVRINSTDAEVSHQAMKEWDAAVERYREHLEALAPFMSDNVRKLAYCEFHDAEVLVLRQLKAERTHWSSGRLVDHLLFVLQTEETLEYVLYVLRADPVVMKHESPTVFSEGKFWLYDEVKPDQDRLRHAIFIAREGELPNPNDFVHFVLLSDGREIEIPFAEVFVTSIPLSKICAEAIFHSNGELAK